MQKIGRPPLIAGHMASTFAVSRNHLIFGLCLPIALLLGYLLADAQDPMSLFVVGVAFVILSIPLLMKWYHPLLVFAWNLNAYPALPGRPALWAMLAFIGLLVAVLNRALDQDNRVAPVPSLTFPVVAVLIVVILTATATGGIGIGSLGSSTVGGKKFFHLIAAILGFFVLASRAVPPSRAPLYVALFFLPGIMAAAGRIATWMGPAGNIIYFFFPPDVEQELVASAEVVFSADIRLRGVATGASLVFLWVLARIGVGGLFDWSKPWRLLILPLILFTAGLGGFRSVVIYMLLTFVILFYLEKLWRTRVALVLVVTALVLGATLAVVADKLPFSVQRTLSFLPLDFDPAIKLDAENSSEWRLDMWREAVKQVPTYLFKGKGYAYTADDLYMSNFSVYSGRARNWETALLTGDYHNGPLSLLIPFGIYGLIAFLWLLLAGGRFLYKNYRDGMPELRRINALLFACFLARALFFMTIYGAIASDLAIFTGILGLSIALNVPQRSKVETQPAPDLEISPQI